MNPFPSWPFYSEQEAESVRELVLSNKVNYWTGDITRTFETEFAAKVGCDHAVAVMNGSVALELALRACHLEPDDEVIVTPRSFVASVSAVVLAGSIPVFADIDPDTQNLSADTIRECLSEKTKAILIVHLAGVPADMDPIMKLAKERNLKVIEDCAQAHGALYKGRPVGSIGDFGVWSFCQDKIMTTGGEGGMVTTSSIDAWKFIWSYKDHGKSSDTIAVKPATKAQKFKWVHDSFGTNMRMLEYQAVFGRVQLTKLDDWVEARRANAERIRTAASAFSALRIPVEQADVVSSYYRCYLFVRSELLKDGESRDTIIARLAALGVPCVVGSCPEIYLEKAFDGTGYRPKNRLPVARQLGETSLSFLVHPTLREQDLDLFCEGLDKVMTAVSR